ncbi:hypothetical protein GGR57DRAFT_487877 [Xylariaceae sp. FL1272]|nr:hypothetical protein GGR57DRAFT_487877 [Xylariaceae sp. FL1272]
MPKNYELDAALLLKAAGKTVIVTGAANGIGLATARLYNEHGAKVVVADLPIKSPGGAESLLATFSNPNNAVFTAVDILDWRQMVSLFADTKGRFGCIDIVIANAGIMETHPVLDVDSVDEQGQLRESKEAFTVIDINLKGTLNTLRLAMHHMRALGGTGSVVLVASTSGYFGGTGVSAYVASKHGVVGLLRSSQIAAKKYGVRVNCVAPFFTPTHITASYAKRWNEAGIEANTAAGVAATIANISLDETVNGSSYLVCGSILRELEQSRVTITPQWLGKDFVDLMADGSRLFEELGGYPLPRQERL